MILQLKFIPVLLLLIAGVIFSISSKKLTVAGAFTGFVCGLLLYIGAGYLGLLMLTVFFLGGTVATSWGRRKKQVLVKPGDQVRRTAAQVLANAGMATCIACLRIGYPEYQAVLLVMLSGTLASALSDTLSSELGMLYGKHFYNCISWKKDQCGLDGVVSIEGTLIGLAGAVVIAGMYALTEGMNMSFAVIVIAGAAGNFADSFLGATAERRGILKNDMVNFLSTLFAAVVALLFCLFFNLF
ncbi:TIGR00297 family protein [Pedobacter westerhofensis]|uniref:TIGR00297 family protein n=1 Tax=Pedobacter westerhofensis TaxID=425512 RepID=A0A521FNM6_9SPHI|nr:DUF92 domain-containing protein [Pedobacter westerhofensis]SMO97762.1 TIGR00297 family protein [Pedobacter westerhofensis]